MQRKDPSVSFPLILPSPFYGFPTGSLNSFPEVVCFPALSLLMVLPRPFSPGNVYLVYVFLLWHSFDPCTAPQNRKTPHLLPFVFPVRLFLKRPLSRRKDTEYDGLLFGET